MLLDNGRTRALADQVGRQALRCIRCSACLNVCPVYERVGGHAYGSVYPGPIGAILNPLLKRRRHRPADRLAAVRLLAVRRLLRGLPRPHRHPLGPRRPPRPGRRRPPPGGSVPSAQTVAMKAAAATSRSGRRLGLAERFARLGTGVAARFGASGLDRRPRPPTGAARVLPRLVAAYRRRPVMTSARDEILGNGPLCPGRYGARRASADPARLGARRRGRPVRRTGRRLPRRRRAVHADAS